MKEELILSTQDKQVLLEALLEYHGQITKAGNARFTESLVQDLLTRIHQSLETEERDDAG